MESVLTIINDVTVETYGVHGNGRPNDPNSYYFLQPEGATAKIKTTTASAGNLHSISVEREGSSVYFKLMNTNTYLKYTSSANNYEVNWLEGKDDNAKWQEVDPIQANAGSTWKSYTRQEGNDTLYLRHRGYAMYATTGLSTDRVFCGDATWRIEGGMLVPPASTPNKEAYGKKKMQTYAVANTPTDTYFMGFLSNGDLRLIDIATEKYSSILDLEVRYKAESKDAVLVDGASGKFLTADSSGNVSLTEEEQEGSLWKVVEPRESSLDSSVWFSFKSMHPNLSERYLRHCNRILSADTSDRVGIYFNGDASWKLIDRE